MNTATLWIFWRAGTTFIFSHFLSSSTPESLTFVSKLTQPASKKLQALSERMNGGQNEFLKEAKVQGTPCQFFHTGFVFHSVLFAQTTAISTKKSHHNLLKNTTAAMQWRPWRLVNRSPLSSCKERKMPKTSPWVFYTHLRDAFEMRTRWVCLRKEIKQKAPHSRN